MERGNQNLLFHACTFDVCARRFGGGGRVILDFHDPACVRKSPERIVQCRYPNTLSGKMFAIDHGSRAGICGRKTPPIKVRDQARSVCGPVERIIVTQDHDAIASLLKINLEHVGAHVCGTLKANKRIRRCMAESAPMSDNLRAVLGSCVEIYVCERRGAWPKIHAA